MQLTEKLQYIQKKIVKNTNQTFFSHDYDFQKKKLESFKEPKDSLERSYFQYLCQINNLSLIIRIVQNILAIPLIFYYLTKKYTNTTSESSIGNALFLREGITKELIPETLNNEFSKIDECPLNGEIYLSDIDKKFITKKMIKYIKSPMFILKCLMKMGVYSNVINIYKPVAIITHNEYSFTSSFITQYCKEMNIEHINIMHGEKLFDIRDSFVKFSRFYVWDKHYVDLFVKLRADKKQFHVERPNVFSNVTSFKKEFTYELTYYLGGEDEKNLRKLAANLSKLIIPVDKICIRSHPRYSDRKLIEKLFEAYNIQDSSIISVNESLSMTKYVASLYSTVLYEAYLSNKEIVIDDLTDRDKYNKLKKLDYIMLTKEHTLLSSYINRVSH